MESTISYIGVTMKPWGWTLSKGGAGCRLQGPKQDILQDLRRGCKRLCGKHGAMSALQQNAAMSG